MWSLSAWFDEMVDGNEHIGNEAQNNACKIPRSGSCQPGQHLVTLLVLPVRIHTLPPGHVGGCFDADHLGTDGVINRAPTTSL